MRNISKSRYLFYTVSYHKICLKENLSDHQIVWEIISCEISIKLFITRTILCKIKFSVIKFIFVLRTLLVGETHFFFFPIWSIKLIDTESTQNTFWEFHVASIMDYYAIIKNKKSNYWKLLLSQLLPNLCQFSGSAIISENSEDTVSWLFY